MADSDLLGTIEAKEILGIGAADTSYGTALARAITAVSDRIAEAVGTIVYGTVTDYFNGGRPRVWLRSPVAQIVQVVEYDNTTAATLTAETNTTKTDYNYVVGTASGELVRRQSNYDYPFPSGRTLSLIPI